MADEEVFSGFWHPDVYEVGFTRLPHELVEEMHKMSDCELRVVLYIFRHTWGFLEIDNEHSKNKLGKGKKMTTDEFMKGRKKEREVASERATNVAFPSLILTFVY